MEHRTDQQDPQPTPDAESSDSGDLTNTVPCPACHVGVDARCVTRAGKPAREPHGRRYEALEQAAGITEHRAKGEREAKARGYTLYCHDNKAEAELLAAYAARLAARNAPPVEAEAEAGTSDQIIDEATIRALLLTMADRLNNEAQDEPMTEKSRLDLARELAGRDTDLHTALLASTVHVAPGVTRGQYANVLTAVADTLDLVSRFAASQQRCRDIAQRVGLRHCDDSQEWRDAETETNRIWDMAHEAGHTSAELLAAGKAKAAS